MLKYIYTILCVIFLTGIINSQTKRAFIEAAEKAYADKNYYGALIYYNNVLEFDENDPQIIYKSAESARQFNAYVHAAQKYQYLLDSLKDFSFPLATFWLAEMQQKLGKYDQSQKNYEQYLSEYSDQDEYFTAKAKKELASIDFARLLQQKSQNRISINKLGENINTPSSEVGAHSYKEDLYFTTMRFKEEKPLTFPAREISKIFKKSKAQPAVLTEGYINQRDLLVANSAINHDGTKIYYTICEYLNGSELRCDIYVSDLKEDGSFESETKLTDPINLPGTTSTHPNIVIDKTTGKEILYFVSDRPGGAGNLDIWYSILDSKYGFSEPVNIKEINTAYNEITPYYHHESGYLFFSTEGREGMGGYDIYKVPMLNNIPGQVVNLGAPVNSSYDDIYYFLESSEQKAYFSSNREGSFFLDTYFESCCYDIYSADIIKLKLDLNALTYDKLTGRKLKNATVRLIDNDSGVEIARITNDEGNEHIFDLNEDRNYQIIADRENYSPDTIYLSTIGVLESDSIIRKMYLETDKMLLDVFTFTKIGKLPLDSVTVTLIDMSDASKPDIISLNPLDNDHYFMLDRGKLYKLLASKDGYTESIDFVDTKPFDKPGLIKKDLYLDKFVLQDLLPISLYFDNDLPDPRSRSTATSSKYGDLVQDYVNRKEVYKQQYSSPLKPENRESANDEIESFFEGNVKGGYDQFKLFINSLVHELEAGNKVELVFKGYASPRAESKYNLALGQRRVNSVKNEMIIYSNDELRKYFLSGQLNITDISFGQELAPKDVVGDISDERNSIYSIKAANERRVEILRAKRN